MFELIPLEIDSSKVAKYRKYDDTKPSFFDNKAYTLISSSHQLQYIDALEKLFKLYKLADSHFHNLLYIIGQHLFIYQYLEEKYLDALECKEPLDFIKGYLEQTNSLIKRSKSEDALKSKLKCRYIELANPFVKSDTPIKIGNADLVIKAIYQLLRKKHYYSLMQLLEPYEEIPPIEVIDELLKEINYTINYRSYFLAEIAEDILDYTIIHLNKELSRKQYLFIFDLLQISYLFTLSDDEEAKSFEMESPFVPAYTDSTTKTAYLKKIVRNYRNYTKNNL